MRRLPGIACLVAGTLVSVASCGTQAVRHPAPTGDRTAARNAPTGTGWIPPGPALPPDAAPAAAPNLVYLDTLGTFGYTTAVGEQSSLVIYRVRSLSGSTRVAIIAPPSCCNFEFVSAADDDRTFIAAALHGRNTRFYELRLRQDGRPQPLVPLSFRVPGYVLPDSIALAPDGSELAAVTTRRRNGPYRISVVATSTGRMRTWTWRGPWPMYPSWSGDHGIDFITSSQQGARLVRLRTSAPARHPAFRVLASRLGQFGSLASWSPWRVDGLTVTADGRTAFASLTGGGDWNNGDAPRIALLRLSATTGRTLQVLARPWAVPEGNSEYSCGVIWADASGRHFLFTCGLTAGRVDDGRFTHIYLQPTPYVPFPDSVFAW